ncbi:WD40 repeat-like protein [Meredithblackwellia eburnea MCA 4105]
MSFFNAKPAEPADIQVPDLPSDSISSLAWSPTADFLSVASWSNEVRIYEVNGQGQAVGKAAYSHEGPVLCVEWSQDGTKIISGGADKAGRIYDLQTGQSSQFAGHAEPIRSVRWISSPSNPSGLVVTGSWDKTLSYWDMRSPTPVANVQLPERVFSLDVKWPLMVVGTADRNILFFDLNNPTTPFKIIMSPLRWQTRTVSCFPDASGYALGTVEGRVAIQYFEEKQSPTGNYTFKCHRKEEPGSKQSIVFAVNDITFHPYGTFCTSGSDGTINIWDKDSKTRLKIFDNRGGPVVCSRFNRTGNVLAYAVAPDWSTGSAGYNADAVNKVCLHALKEEEVKKRVKK